MLSEVTMLYSDILYVQSKLIAAYYEEEFRGRGDVVCLLG